MNLQEHLGNSPRIKILEFFVLNKTNSYGIREIMLGANVKHRTLVSVVDDLLKKDLIYIERKIGRSHLYKVNADNRFIQTLISLAELK